MPQCPPPPGRQGLDHSAANFEVLGGDPHLRRSVLVLLGTSCPGHSSGDAGALLGAPSWGPSHRLQHTSEGKTPRRRGVGPHSSHDTGPCNGVCVGVEKELII